MKGRVEIDEDSPILNISVAADILGLHVRTLMLYEYEKLVIPQRNKLNYRLYSQKQIKHIQFIQYLTRKKGLNFAGVRMVITMLKKSDEKGFDLRKEMFPDFKEN